MNLNFFLGGILFLLWSTFSSWYYVCQIKGLCPETEISIPSQTEIAVAKDELVTETVEPEKPAPSPILIEEDKIYFIKNTTQFVEPEKVSLWIEGLVPEVEGRGMAIHIVGHTCDLGSESYNLDLGQRRADAMKVYLQSQLNNVQYQTQSKGESEASPGTENQRQLNRKVSITIKSIDQ